MNYTAEQYEESAVCLDARDLHMEADMLCQAAALLREQASIGNAMSTGGTAGNSVDRNKREQAKGAQGEAVADLRKILAEAEKAGYTIDTAVPLDTIRAVLAATAPRAAVPDGFVLVPIEPTIEMLRAEDAAIPSDDSEDDGYAWSKASWKAMLSASPTPDKEPK